MPNPQTVTLTVYHPYPAFYWEVKLQNSSSWIPVEEYAAYVDPQPVDEGQGTNKVTIDAVEGEQAVLRCTIGPLSAGVPVYREAGTVTTDEIPVTVGALTWDVNPAGKNVTIQVIPAGFFWKAGRPQNAQVAWADSPRVIPDLNTEIVNSEGYIAEFGNASTGGLSEDNGIKWTAPDHTVPEDVVTTIDLLDSGSELGNQTCEQFTTTVFGKQPTVTIADPGTLLAGTKTPIVMTATDTDEANGSTGYWSDNSDSFDTAFDVEVDSTGVEPATRTRTPTTGWSATDNGKTITGTYRGYANNDLYMHSAGQALTIDPIRWIAGEPQNIAIAWADQPAQIVNMDSMVEGVTGTASYDSRGVGSVSADDWTGVAAGTTDDQSVTIDAQDSDNLGVLAPSRQVSITVTGQNPTIDSFVSAPVGFTATEGAPITFTCNVTPDINAEVGNADLTYVWTPLTGGVDNGNGTYTIANPTVAGNDGNTVECKVQQYQATDEYKETASNPLTVNAFGWLPGQPEDATVEWTSAGDLRDIALAGLVTNATGTVTFTKASGDGTVTGDNWKLSNTNLPGAYSAVVNAADDGTGTNEDSQSFATTVTGVNPTATISDPGTITEGGGPVNLTATPDSTDGNTAFTYAWSWKSGTGSQLSNETTQTVTIDAPTVADDNGDQLSCVVTAYEAGSGYSVAADSVPLNVESGGVGPNYDDMILSVAIPTENLDFTLPFQSAAPVGGYNFSVAWGDGTIDEDPPITAHDDARLTHTYPAAATYEITVSGQANAPYFANGAEKDKLVDIKQWGRTGWTVCTGGFQGCSSLTDTAAGPESDFSAVTTMGDMFRSSSVASLDVSQWQTGAVTNMLRSFQSCTSLQAETFNVANWDTSSVANMSKTFISCTNLNPDISNWDISALTNASQMLQSSAFTDANYKATIVKWAAQAVNDVPAHFGNASLVGEDPASIDAQAARTQLTTLVANGGNGWTILDGDGTWPQPTAANANGEVTQVTPDAPIYWSAIGPSGDVVHTGDMDAGLTIRTGQANIIYSSDMNAYLADLNGSTAAAPPLPAAGTPLEPNEVYAWNAQNVVVRQSHIRTNDDPDTVPALFSVWRENYDGLHWIENEEVLLGYVRKYDGADYECTQSHTTQAGWTPPATPSLWTEVVSGIQPWEQPAGAHDAYQMGDKVTHNGSTWESDVNDNVWEPGVYGWSVITTP